MYMTGSASIAQEFFKIREEWARADKLKTWRLAIFVAEYQDIDILDKFIETERLPIGMFEDIFFRFDTEFKGDVELFERQLWQEYESWCQSPDEKKDVLLALKKDEVLDPNFQPQFNQESGFGGLLNEMLRLKSSLKNFDKLHFCLYFPPCRPDANLIGSWLQMQLKKGVPNAFRLVTIDFAAGRTIDIQNNQLLPQIIEIIPHLNMMEAINNEMDKGGGSSDTVGVDARFRKQIRMVMESTLKKDKAHTDREVKKMLSISREMGNQSSIIAALLVAAQAHYNIKDHHHSELYTEQAIQKAEVEMNKGDLAGYHSWKACIMLKGALLAAKRKWEQSIGLYEKLAEKATEHSDIFFIMEGYRISGHLYYLRGRVQQALENSLLALVAGSHLDKKMIRESTFLHAAYVALFIARSTKTKEEVNALEEQLAVWIGDDWQEILDDSDMQQSIVKPKSRLAMAFSPKE